MTCVIINICPSRFCDKLHVWIKISENNNTDSESQFSQETLLSQAIKECKVHIQSSSERTQQRYISKAETCFELMLSTVCP